MLKSLTARIYLIVPNIEKTAEILKNLWERKTMVDGIHIVVKDFDQVGTKQLLESGLFKTTDVAGALLRGAISGGLLGMIVGFILTRYPPEEFSFGIGSTIALSIFGTLFGAWASSLIGVSILNPTVEKIKKATEAGSLIMLIDLPKSKENEVTSFIKSYYPETTFCEIDLPELESETMVKGG